MAEVHIIGQIIGASDFAEHSLFCKWMINTGSAWNILEGHHEGQTHLNTRTGDGENFYWSHPIDVHYMTRGLQGWPRIEFQVWGVDWLGKANISGYGFMSIPTQPGQHRLECSLWRPVGNFRRRLINYVTGLRMHLIDQSDIVSQGLGRQNIQAQSMGSVHVELCIILKDFEKYGVEIRSRGQHSDDSIELRAIF